MTRIHIHLLAGALLVAVGYAPTSNAQPVAVAPTQFVYTPPSASPKFPGMVIGFSQPRAQGTLFHRDHHDTKAMLSAAEVDLAKIIIAKGFESAGSNLDRATLSDARKEQMSLLAVPEFKLELRRLASQPARTQIQGSVTLLFTEPASGARIWKKTIQIAAFTSTEPASSREILTAFYPVMMQQIWDQINPVDFRVLAIKMVPD